MTVKELAEKANLKIISGKQGLDVEIRGGYTCDLLSDVMGHADEGYVWITLQTHKNVMAIASLKELSAIILVKGLMPEVDTLEQSDKENIPILSSDLEAFEISGMVYQFIQNASVQS